MPMAGTGNDAMAKDYLIMLAFTDASEQKKTDSTQLNKNSVSYKIPLKLEWLKTLVKAKGNHSGKPNFFRFYYVEALCM